MHRQAPPRLVQAERRGGDERANGKLHRPLSTEGPHHFCLPSLNQERQEQSHISSMINTGDQSLKSTNFQKISVQILVCPFLSWPLSELFVDDLAFM